MSSKREERPCKQPLAERSPCQGDESQKNFAVGFHLLTCFPYLLHDGLGVLPFLKLHVHLEGHEVDGGIRHTRSLAGGVFHQVGAVGSVHIDLISFFHFGKLLS